MTAVAAAGQPCHDTSGHQTRGTALIAQGGLDCYLGSPHTGVPSGRKLGWVCLMDMPEWYLDRQKIAMLRVDWSWLPFSRSARSKGGGDGI